MGASISIHPEIIKSTEVSFVDKKTGRLFTQEEINKICEKACKEFDYKPAFYDSYKVGKNGKKPYAELAKRIAEGSNK
jgi:hypothetical protein